MPLQQLPHSFLKGGELGCLRLEILEVVGDEVELSLVVELTPPGLAAAFADLGLEACGAVFVVGKCG